LVDLFEYMMMHGLTNPKIMLYVLYTVMMEKIVKHISNVLHVTSLSKN